MGKLSSPKEIKEILTRHGFFFSKALGQNFLTDGSVCPRMAAGSGADKETGVIEIGPGIGVLTWELAQVAQKVVAVEIDDRLLPVLKETLAECENVKVVHGDIMKIDLQALIDREFSGKEVCVCANLPYYITSPILMYLLESKLPLDCITVMVQKEAAQRICALPGTRECGAVSISVHYHCEPEQLFQVGRNAFLPPPNVDSAVIRLKMRKRPPVEVLDEKWFFKVSRSAFGQRRKTVANSVSSILKLPKKDVESAIAEMGLDRNVRAEQLELQAFAALSNLMLKSRKGEREDD